jgi:hypothetical protein
MQNLLRGEKMQLRPKAVIINPFRGEKMQNLLRVSDDLLWHPSHLNSRWPLALLFANSATASASATASLEILSSPSGRVRYLHAPTTAPPAAPWILASYAAASRISPPVRTQPGVIPVCLWARSLRISRMTTTTLTQVINQS